MYFNLFFGMEAKKPPFREALKLVNIIEVNHPAVGKGRDAVETQSLPDLLFALLIVALINNFADCESVTDTVDALDDILAGVAAVRCGISDMLID